MPVRIKFVADVLGARLCIDGWASQRSAGMEAVTPCRGRSRRLVGKLLLMHLMTGCLNTSKLIIYAAKFSLLQARTAPAWLQKLELHARLKLLNYVFHDKNVFLMTDVMVWGKKSTGRWRAKIFSTVHRFYQTNAGSCYGNWLRVWRHVSSEFNEDVPGKQGGCARKGKKKSEINFLFFICFINSFSTVAASFLTQSKHGHFSKGHFLPGLHTTVSSSVMLPKMHG